MAMRPQPVDSIGAFASDTEQRLRRIEASISGRVLPQGYLFRVNGLGQLEVLNIATNTSTVIL